MYWKRIYRYRRSAGIIFIVVGGMLLVVFVPVWLWIAILGGILLFIGWLLYKLC